jgi:hypothetical protein
MHKKILKQETSNQESTVFPIYIIFTFTITFRVNRTYTSITATTYNDIHNSYMGTIQSRFNCHVSTVWNNQKWNLYSIIIDVQTVDGIGYNIIAK